MTIRPRASRPQLTPSSPGPSMARTTVATARAEPLGLLPTCLRFRRQMRNLLPHRTRRGTTLPIVPAARNNRASLARSRPHSALPAPTELLLSFVAAPDPAPATLLAAISPPSPTSPAMPLDTCANGFPLQLTTSPWHEDSETRPPGLVHGQLAPPRPGTVLRRRKSHRQLSLRQNGSPLEARRGRMWKHVVCGGG